MHVNGINPAQFAGSLTAGSHTKSAKPANFAAMINHYVQQTNQQVHAAGKATTALAEGKQTGSLSETLMSMQKAGMSAQLLLAVRNKLLDAYREVMRMPV